MANEVFYSTSGAARLAETLNANIMLLLADRQYLWRHSAITMLPDASGSGSTVIKTPIVSLGAVDSMAAVAEGSSTSNTALGLSSFAVTIARQALQREISGLNDIVDSTGAVNVMGLANEGFELAAKRFTDLVAVAGASFTNTVGTTTVDMVTDDYYDATYQLEQNSVPGPWLAMLFPVQFTDFRESLRSEGGAQQFQSTTAEMLALKGPGFKGSFLGVDIFASNLVPTATAGADSGGCMFGTGAIAFREGSRSSVAGAAMTLLKSPVITVLEQDAAGDLTKIVHNYYVGVSKTQDLMGVAIVTDR